MFTKAFERGRNGWALGREAFALMKEHPKLIVFPVLSGIAFVALLAAIAFGAILKPEMFGLTVSSSTMARGARAGMRANVTVANLLPYVWGLGLYLTLTFVATFFNVALCSTVLHKHLTGRVSLRDGFSGAISRLPYILAWSLFAATIGLLLAMLKKVMEDYLSWFGWLFGTLLETAWAATVYFVAPVLAVERIGPIAALKESAGLLKARWRETAGAEFSTAWALWPLHLFGFVSVLGLLWCTAHIGGAGTFMGVAVFGALSALYMLASTTLHSIMSGIVKSNMYIYAKTGEVPAGSDAQVYARAFGPAA